MSASASFHANAFPWAEKTSFGWNSVPATAWPGRQLRYRSYCMCYDRCLDNHRNTGTFSQRNERRLLHALPLQAVTTDNDSEGSGVSPSSSVEYAGIFQADQGSRQPFLYDFQSWYARAKNQDVRITCKQVLEKLNRELRMVDKNQVLQDVKSSRWLIHGMRSWSRMQPWIKWPITIFLPWFMLISTFYGISASMDLLPLWIVGPLMAGAAVKASMQMYESCRQWAADRKLSESALHVIEGVRTGQLPRYLVEVAGSRCAEVKEKTAYTISFIKSGEIIVVLRQYMYRKFMEKWEAWVDKYEDWRLVYLRLQRTLKNIV
eukprot:c22290_g1_i1 orf=387-1343(+)